MRFLIWIVLAVAALFVPPVAAQSVCGMRQSFVEQLANRYQEEPAALGMIDNGNVLEVLTSPDGSWTILVTMPNGQACLVTSGEGWVTIPRAAKGPGA